MKTVHSIIPAALAVASAAIFGCASTARVEETLNTYLGLSEDQLVQRLGPPNAVYETPQAKYLTYGWRSSGYFTGAPPSGKVVGKTPPSASVQSFPYSPSCRVTFGVEKSYVTTYRYDACA